MTNEEYGSTRNIQQENVETQIVEDSAAKNILLDKSFRRIDNDGYDQYLKSKTNLERLFWIILFIFAISIAGYEICKAVSDYYNSPIVTSYKIISRKEMSFPQIYLCPSSPVRKSYLLLNGDKVNRALELGNHLFIKEDAKMHKSNNKSIDKNYMKKRSIIDDLEIFGDEPSMYDSSLFTEMIRKKRDAINFGNLQNRTKTHELFSHDSSEFLNQTFMEMGISQADLFLLCQFRSFFLNIVPCKNIATSVLDPLFGKCYLIDVGESRKQGVPAQGLTLFLNLKTQEYPSNGNLTPKFTGLVMSVAQKYDPSGFETILIPPNSYTRVDIQGQHLQFINVDSGPSKQLCNTEDDFPFQYLNASYSQASCYLECHLRTVVTKCNCLLTMDHIFYNTDILANVTFCNLSQATECIMSTVDNSDEAQIQIQQCKDQCQVPCESWRYNTRVSHMPLNEYQFPGMYPNTTIDDYVFVQIAFPFLEYEEFVQDWAMTVADLVSTIGSHFGLWVGASMITLIQIPIVLFSLCGFQFYSKSEPIFKKASRSLSRAVILHDKH